MELTPGVDEVSLALVADAWSRTYRSRAMTFSRTDGRLRAATAFASSPIGSSRAGLRSELLPAIGDRQPAGALDEALRGITARYGVRTADFVAMQLEYPRQASPNHASLIRANLSLLDTKGLPRPTVSD